MKTINLGTFECVSGNFDISDPCYAKDVWCRGVLENVKKGTWIAEIEKAEYGDWGERIWILSAKHLSESLKTNASNGHNCPEGGLQMKLANFDVGVDSGQAGIFDSQYYKDGSVFDKKCNFYRGHEDEENLEEQWYGHCCDITLLEPGAGVIPHGVVSRSGIGDGSYYCYVMIDENTEIVEVTIVFLNEDEEEEGDDE